MREFDRNIECRLRSVVAAPGCASWLMIARLPSLRRAVFGVPGLVEPGSFRVLAADAVRRVEALVAELQTAAPGEAVVEALDDVSDAARLLSSSAALFSSL